MKHSSSRSLPSRGGPWRAWPRLLAVAALCGGSASATILLEIESIPGSSTLGPFQAQIACDSFRFDVDRADPGPGSSTFELEVPVLGSVRLEKPLGIDSSPLLRRGISGATLGPAVIRFFDPTISRGAQYMQVVLDSAFIKSWVTATGDTSRPRETIELWYTRISVHTAAEAPSGEVPRADQPTGWDRLAGRPWTSPLEFDPFLNQPPVARTDSVPRASGLDVKVKASSLLANDSDPDGDPFALIDVGSPSPAGATVTRTGDWIVYTSSSDAAGSFSYTLRDEYGATATGLVHVNIASSPGRLDLVARIERMPSDPDLFRITFAGVPGLQYRILLADRLDLAATWSVLGAVTADPKGQVTYVDRGASTGRFYRLVYP